MGGKDEGEFFTTLRGVKKEIKEGNFVLLYLYDKRDKKKLKVFEDSLFRDDQIALSTKLFSCMKLDLGVSPKAYRRLLKRAPRFVFIGPNGKICEDISFAGYKSRATTFFKAMTKVITKNSDLDIGRYIKEERKILTEFDKVGKKKKKIQEKISKAKIKSKGKETSTIRKLKKEEKILLEEESKIREVEKKLLAKLNLKVEMEKK